eukprot:ANDGO_03026.mRNA.1 hypothetical protein
MERMIGKNNNAEAARMQPNESARSSYFSTYVQRASSMSSPDSSSHHNHGSYSSISSSSSSQVQRIWKNPRHRNKKTQCGGSAAHETSALAKTPTLEKGLHAAQRLENADSQTVRSEVKHSDIQTEYPACVDPSWIGNSAATSDPRVFRYMSPCSPVRVDGNLSAYAPSKEDLNRLDEFRKVTNSRRSLDLFLEERSAKFDAQQVMLDRMSVELDRVTAERDDALSQVEHYKEMVACMMQKIKTAAAGQLSSSSSNR